MVTIGFSTTNKWMSKLIRFFTRAPISHVWLSYYDETLGTKMVLQAEWFSYEVRPWARWIRENELIKEYQLLAPKDELTTALQIQATCIGLKYDYLAAGWTGLLAWTRKKFKGSPYRLMCSESVLRFFQLCPTYKHWFSGLDVENTGPLPVMRRCEALDSMTNKVLQRVLPG